MKIKLSAFLKLSFALFALTLCLVGCVKNENTNTYDTKVRFINVIDEKAQDFYLNGIRVATGVGYGSNSSYITAVGDREYSIFAKNTETQIFSDSIKFSLGVGKNYSVYYSKTAATDSILTVLEDNLSRDTASVRLFFINHGYTLNSKVSIRSQSSTFSKILGLGENSGYVKLPANKTSDIYLNLLDSVNVIDTIPFTNFVKGSNNTILIDGINKGSRRGKLRERVIVSSN